MRPIRSTVVLACVATLGVATTAYALLGPSKASQLVTVSAFGACPLVGFGGAANSLTFQSAVRADGSTTPLVIPPKQVFVLTDATLTASGEPANDAILSILGVGTGSAGAPVAGRYDTTGPAGSVTAVFEFPAGIAVKSTSIVCATMFNQTHPGGVVFSAIAHGYFAPDK